MRYFKFTLFILFCVMTNITFTQTKDVDAAVEERIRRISTIVVEQINLQSEPGYYIPSFGFGFRFSGETLFNGQVSNKTVPVFGWFIDGYFLRFSTGFGIIRLQIETPFTQEDSNSSVADISLINSKYTLSGGFGGGFRFLDTRIQNAGRGNVLTVTFLAIVGSRFGIKEISSNPTSLFGGAEFGFTYQYYFHRYASIRVGWDLGLRLGASSTAIYNMTIGMSF